ncbi:MAG: PEP/pyruvate-binding domain-containing protein [Alphaproteobacteria bacterium]
MSDSLIRQPAAATDPAIVGGKAAALARLGSAGFDVPPWFVVPPPSTDDGPVDNDGPALDEALAGLGEGPFAVRSSGAGEDGARDSHAGQFLSLLEVPSTGVPDAIAQVRASGLTDSVAGYRNARGLGGGITPAVIVQRMVRARVAGVAFSADPVTGARDEVLVDAVAGLADRLVGGEVDGELWRVARATLQAHIARPADQPALTAGDAAAVAALALRVEAVAGSPQDIEWAFEGDRLYLLQARPITTLGTSPPLDDDSLLILDNSNIVESYPGVVAPLTFSFARHVYAHVYRVLSGLLGVPEAMIGAQAVTFDNLLARTHGRVYYNLLNWYRILALLPGFRLNRGYMETMMGVAEALPADLADSLAPPPARGLARIGEWLRIGRVGFGLVRHAHRLPRTIRAFQARLDVALADDPARLDTLPPTALAAEYRKLEAALLERWDAPLVNDLICMIAFGASRRLLEKWAGAAGVALHGDVLIGQSDIVSAEPARLVRQMGLLLHDDPELLDACRRGDPSVVVGATPLAVTLRSYLARFGDRCTEELKLESTPLTDDPAPILHAIAAASRTISPPPSRMESGPDETQARLNALFRRRPLRRWLAWRLLGWSKRRVRDRENLRFERTRLFGRVRRIFRAIGRQFHALGLLADPDDIFLLTVDEVLGAIEGGQVSEDLRGITALRKAEMARFATLPDPPERLHLRGIAVAARHADATPATETATGDSRNGLACCSGIACGPVRVVRDPKREVVQPGEILVARHTDPGWIAQFASAAAVVVERGSLLSHSAIVARELGIPCVVGVKGATDWLATGDLVTVDGGRGIVSRSEP